MNRVEVQQRLEEFMERGLPHRAWDFARELIESPGDPALRRVLKYRFLRTFLLRRLPASFWNERRQEEARRLGLDPIPAGLRVGEVAFPVVFPGPEMGCFVVASVRSIKASQDEFPDDREVDEAARRAMAEALEAARRLTGEKCHFRVALDKPFAEPVKGASCGLAVALAALSCIDDRQLDDSLVATGEVTRELAVRSVSDLDRKSALRREARPLAQLLCPAGHPAEDGLVPVSRLEDARAAAWKPIPRATEEALAEFKRARAEDPANLHLPFRGLAKIARGSAQTSLPLLGFAVAPSLREEHTEQAASETELRHQLRDPNLKSEARLELKRKLRQLEQRHWGSRSGGDEASKSFSFAQALHHSRRFTVIGEPGAGKSVLTRLAFLACAEGQTGIRARELLGGDAWFRRHEAEAIHSLRVMLPVRLELGAFGQALADRTDLSLESFIRRELRDEGARSALQDGLSELLHGGRLFLLCDGLDEVSEELRERVVDGVSAFVKSYPRVRILVTSRPHGYYPQVPGFDHTWLAPLGYWQQRTLIARIHRLVEAQSHPGPEGVKRARRRTNELLQAIELRREWEELISNPLLLTLSALARTTEEGVPAHQVIIFEGIIQTILQEWRIALKRPSQEADRLLEAWYSVAFELVQREERHGVGKGRLRRMLSDKLGAGSPIDATLALTLALEAGLVRENGSTVAFWHSTFAEFLAARFLAEQPGDPKRLLASRLTPLSLKFAVALLDHEFDAHDECNAIARELMARDEEGANPLLRSGLRTVSTWLAEGVRFSPDTRERIWEAWIEVLERTPPSPLWGDFGKFADRVPPESLAPRLVARLALVKERRVEEVREGIARIVAPAAARVPAARAACEQWLQAPSHSALRIFGAFGLASTGEWSDAVIQALGRFGTTRKLPLHALRTLVRGSSDTALERLRSLARQRFPSEEQQGSSNGNPLSEAQRREEPTELRLSAACLLAAAGHWDDDIARVMRLALAGTSAVFQEDELLSVLRSCSYEEAVREALLGWISDGSVLGERARKMVRDIAPLFEDMPEKVLERMVEAHDEGREKLEQLLVSIGEELHTLPELLGQGLDDEHPGEQQLCAARVLRRLAEQDRRLHEALRHGMRSRDEVERARWAYLALGLGEELTHIAMETLAECSRSPDERVRAEVYGASPLQLPWRLRTKRLEAWLKIAADRGVAPQARLDALQAVEQLEVFREQVAPLLRDLLHVDDVNVRRSVAERLTWQGEVSPEAVVVLAKEAVRGGRENYVHLRMLRKMVPLASLVVQTLLRELSGGVPPKDSQDPHLVAMSWSRVLEELTEANLSCVEQLLLSIESPGLAGRASQFALGSLLKKHAVVRCAFRQALREAVSEKSHVGQFRLVQLGLEEEETRPEAIELSRTMDLAPMTQAQLDRLAHLLHQAGEAQAAARLWRLVLEGNEPGLVLDAAELLADHFPEEALAWVQAGVQRALHSPVPAHQIGAGRFALHFGVFEEQALRALVSCLEETKEQTTWDGNRHWFRYLSVTRHRELHPDDEDQLDQVLRWPPRADFEAMYELCAHRPDIGLPHLAAWLEDEDLDRLSASVKLLAGKEAYREQVRVALERRLHTEPAGTLHVVIQLIEAHGFYSKRMVEQLLARYEAEESADDPIDRAINTWLRQRPELWAVFREQPPKRRDKLARWLQRPQPIQRDTVVFAAEFVLIHASDWDMRYVESTLERWCKPLPAQEEQEEGPRTWSPEQVRGWIREVLAEQNVPANLFVLAAFDRLAAMAGLPASERIQRLHQALAMDAAVTEEDGNHLQYLQGLTALRLLELGDRDERIPRVLEATVHLLAATNDVEAFRFMRALKPLQPPHEALRSALVRIVLRTHWGFDLELVLDLLDWVGLTVKERIELLIARLKSEAGRSELLELLDALATLGCPSDQLAALTLEYVAAHEEKLSPGTLLRLAVRPEFSLLAEAKLVLTALARSRSWGADEALSHWVNHFASQVSLTGDDRWWMYGDSDYLSLRQRTLANLSKVDEPALVDQALAELATARASELLALYRPARAGGALSSADWRELVSLLIAQPHDPITTLFAKEWLTLVLWQNREPETVMGWFRS